MCRVGRMRTAALSGLKEEGEEGVASLERATLPAHVLHDAAERPDALVVGGSPHADDERLHAASVRAGPLSALKDGVAE